MVDIWDPSQIAASLYDLASQEVLKMIQFIAIRHELLLQTRFIPW